MYERKRQAIDIAGNEVELLERCDDEHGAVFLGANGDPLIAEGDDFFRTLVGVRLKIVDGR